MIAFSHKSRPSLGLKAVVHYTASQYFQAAVLAKLRHAATTPWCRNLPWAACSVLRYSCSDGAILLKNTLVQDTRARRSQEQPRQALL